MRFETEMKAFSSLDPNFQCTRRLRIRSVNDGGNNNNIRMTRSVNVAKSIENDGNSRRVKPLDGKVFELKTCCASEGLSCYDLAT